MRRTTKLNLNIATLLVFVCGMLFPLSPVHSMSEMEKFHVKMIKTDPKSEAHLYGYANFLYKKDRFQEANQYVNRLLILNPDHKMGKRLKNNINRLSKIQDPQRRAQEKKVISQEDLNVALKDIEQIASDLTSDLNKDGRMEEYRQNRDSRKALFRKKYEIDRLASKQYKPALGELTDESSRLAQQYESSKVPQEADKYYQKLLAKYPDSPSVFTRYIQFLVRQKNYTQAKAYCVRAQSRFPEEITLRYLNDFLKEVDQFSTEARWKKEFQMGTDILLIEELKRDLQ